MIISWAQKHCYAPEHIVRIGNKDNAHFCPAHPILKVTGSNSWAFAGALDVAGTSFHTHPHYVYLLY